MRPVNGASLAPQPTPVQYYVTKANIPPAGRLVALKFELVTGEVVTFWSPEDAKGLAAAIESAATGIVVAKTFQGPS